MYNDIRLSEIIASVFYEAHRAIKNHDYTYFRFMGGRGGMKSTFISLEILLLLKKNPNCHALIMRSKECDIRHSVYPQVLWAIGRLGLEKEFKSTVSPMEITYIPTGQKILFRGANVPGKFKSIKFPFGLSNYIRD